MSLVKNLSRLQEELKFSQTFLEIGQLSFLRGSLTEFVGEASTGKTSLALMLLSVLTQNGEVCAIVDINNSFNPYAAAQSHVTLDNLLWVRCEGNVEHAFSATQNLIQAKGFGLIWLNLNAVSDKALNHIPTAFWYRFRTKIKDSPTLLIVTAKRSILGAASQQSFFFDKSQTVWSGSGRFKLLQELKVNLITRKPFLTAPTVTAIEAKYSDV